MSKYYFYIPEYNNISNGIRLLWEAAYLFSYKRDVKIITYQYGYATEEPDKYKKLKSNEIDKITDDDIIIYPDGVKGNPLNCKKICRYLMAKPYILNGEGVDYESRDFVFAYSNATQILVQQYNIFTEEFLSLNKWHGYEKVKGKITIYYGKCRVGIKYTNISKILRGATEVYVATRMFPTDKEVLYREIASSELFISLDPLTSLLYESTLIGTPALVADNVFENLYLKYNHTLYGFYFNYDEFKKSDNGKLGPLAYNNYIKELNSNKDKTINIINKIENHFKNISLHINNNELVKEDLRFYLNEWKALPIINVTSFKSILLLHLLQKNKVIFSILLSIYLLFSSITKNIKIYIKKQLINIIHPLTYDILNLNRKRKFYIIKLNNINSIQESKSKKLKISKFILILMWSM